MLCGHCKAPLKDQVDSFILCDFCQQWYHLKRVDLTKDEAATISRLGTKGVRWACKICSLFSSTTHNQLDRIEKVLDHIKSLVSVGLEPKFEANEKSYAMAVKNIGVSSTVVVGAV